MHLLVKSFASFAIVALSVVACGDEDDGGLRLPTRTASASDAGATKTDPPGSTTTPGTGTGTGTTPTPPTEPQVEEESGEATYYDADGTGACGSPTSNASLVAAMNGVQYSKAVCGKCAEVKGPLGSVVVKILDKCPGCSEGDLDLSETAFVKIAKKIDGRVKITWHYVTCP